VLPFFPTPYPDELLYSVFARYHRWSKNAVSEHTSIDLFGRLIQSTVELPSNIEALCQRLSSNASIEADTLVADHTLYNLYKPFLPEDRQKRVMERMKSQQGGLEALQVSGILPSKIRAPRFLKYCNECLKSDERVYGESYWHRSHQPFGVYVCHEHNIWLENSNIAFYGMRDRWAYYCLDSEFVNKPESLFNDWAHLDHHLGIARTVKWLLVNDVPSFGLDNIHKGYLYFLKKKGYATFSGDVKRSEVIKALVDFYDKEFLKNMESPLENIKRDTWVGDVLRKPNKAIHPIRHILFMRFLGVRPEDFWESRIDEDQPFGMGPWPCLNPASAHYKNLVITDCKVTRSGRTKGPVGKFYCDCGFAYSRLGPDKGDKDLMRFDHVILYGAVWDKEVLRLAEIERLSLRRIGKKLNVCHHTIRKRLDELRGQQAINFDRTDKRDRDIKREQCRNRIIYILRMNPTASRSQVEALAIAEYNWLYRNDGKWLEEQLPLPKPAGDNFKPKVDWLKRDEELSMRVADAALQIRKRPGKPIRITTKAIRICLGLRCLTSAMLEKMHKTKAAIESVSESIEDFQIRRVRYIAQQILENHGPFKKWNIVSKSGLSGSYSERVAEEIDRLLSLNSDTLSQIPMF
jgi:hypothetical protein